MRLLPHPSPLILQGTGTVLIVLALLVAAVTLILPINSRTPQPERECGAALTAVRRRGVALTLSNDDIAESDFENECRDAARKRLATSGGIVLVMLATGVVLVRTGVR